MELCLHNLTRLAAPAFEQIEHAASTGFLERGFGLLHEPSAGPSLAAFCRRYSQHIFRFDSMVGLDSDVVDRFLLEGQIDMLASGAAPLHEWWEGRLRDGSLNATTLRHYNENGVAMMSEIGAY